MPRTRRGCLIKNSIRSMQKQRKRGKKQRFGELSMRPNLGTKEFRAESGPCDRTHEGKSRAQQTTVEKNE